MRWYVYDGLGSVLGEVDECGVINPDSQGNPTPVRKYDVYGGIRNTQEVAPGTSDHRFVGSLGHTSEAETGLIYMRARYMDPALGRFISEDPAMDGVNWYAYCESNPVNAMDPSGLATLVDQMTSTKLQEGLEGQAGNVALHAKKQFAHKIQGIMWDWVNRYGLALGEDASLVFGEGSMTVTGVTSAKAKFMIMMHLASREGPHIQLWIEGNVKWLPL